MKKVVLIFATLAAGVFSLASFGPQNHSASAVTAFSFKSFDADYYLSRDASTKESELKVDETLVAEFNKFGDNHGIERALPIAYKFNDAARDQSHNLNLKIESVNDKYSTRTESGMEIIRIGDKNKIVHGEKTYKISWSARNVTRNFDDGDEFYWKANGDGWEQSFGRVTARVHVPASLASSLDGRVKCEIGGSSYSSTSLCATKQSDEPGGGKLFTFSSLGYVSARSSLTFDVGFRAGTFAAPQFDPAAVVGVSTAAFWASIVAIVAASVLALIFLIWVIATKRPARAKNAVVPEYLPPKNQSVIKSAAIYGKAKPRIFQAALIELAVTKYARIYEIEKKGPFGKKDYGVELLRDIDDTVPRELRDLAREFFGTRTAGAKVMMKDFNKAANASKRMAIQKISPDTSRKLWDDGEFYRTTYNLQPGIVGAAIFFLIIPPVIAGWTENWLLALLMPVSLILFLASGLYNPISAHGREMQNYLLGLKMYMKTAEAERLKMLQSPDGAEKVRAFFASAEKPDASKKSNEKVGASDEIYVIKLYERLLPYAIIFGMVKEWGKALEIHYAADADYVPAWFLGANMAAFSAANFASAMNSFTTNSYVAGAGGVSSGGSGFSGGGGFAGGGGGGGGGGGW